jgi:uncharacterized repeat protein (TIGR01451 family)
MKKTLFTFFSLALATTTIAQVPNYVPTNGLVGWWPFNGNAVDESVNNYDGIVNGAILTTDRFGNANSAYNFNGTGNFLSLSSTGSNNFVQGATFSAWINTNDLRMASVVDKETGCASVGYRLNIRSNGEIWSEHGCYGAAQSGALTAVCPPSYSINSWILLVGTLNPVTGTNKIYINGTLVNSVSINQMISNSKIIEVGRAFNAGAYEFFKGKIDDIGIWNRALTDCEIRNLYQAGAPSVSIFNDIDQNCAQNAETGVEGVSVSLQPGNLISVSNTNGLASFPSLPDGTYTATIDTTNLNWSASCPVTQTFTVQNGVADCIGFGLVNDNPCTDPDVSIYAPFLRRCLSNQKVYVSACNQNTATGVLNASYVDVELDPLMTVTSSTLPFTPQGNNIYRFETGNINPGQCVNFNISTTISCNANLGQTLCMDANLYPVESCVLDSIPSNPPTNTGGGGTLGGLPQPCTLPWDQSSLSVDGWCQNDTIYFTITNTGDPGGGDMECYSPLWVTVDGVTTFTDSIMIPGGQTITYTFPGDGATWILNASQHPLHPGNSHPNAHVESCGDSTNFTPGQVNEQPLNDADPVVDIYCGTVTGSYDPNDKTGYPLGLTDQRYIQPNQQLQFVIRFQNTGTDTAFTVVIRDTLDTDLNIFTVTPGVSSHPYTFKMYGPRVLEWTFENINLPDSTTDQAGSNGFATFHVEQVPNLAPGTEINNDADIYFDFNDPITTNTTVHRIYEGFVSVLNLEELNAAVGQLLVYPNPTTGAITIHSTKAMNQGYTVHDQMGRTVVTGELNGYDTHVSLSHLAKGMYILKVNGNYKPAQLAKE